ncbi:FtsX-like permease family protein [Agathobaculum sp.]|uniref:FtsX-like permease family protein n=1 Tax=Agathobaculum sp. TaxID=2048138 RepID=UPI002A8299B4|nr:FtsX-like permease family protein [Agathobaculum sp.]MDY3618645.1 FtsX-like permease family protein [Agathobaculum sp.]
MRNLLLPRLALRGLYGNRRLYLPFVLATSFMTMVYFIIAAFVWNDSFGQNIPDGDNIRILMGVGYYLMPIVVVPFLVYVYSYLLKGRSRELALYTVLGLERRHIAGVLLIENLICFSLCLLLGVGAGAVLCPLVIDGLLAALHVRVDIAWALSAAPIAATVKVLAAAFLILLLLGVWRVLRTQPASLLHGQQQGEKPLRAKPLLALLGVLCLAGGYSIALTTNVRTFTVHGFFLALLLVILGTYGVFTAGSAQILGRLRKGGRFYADPSRFIIVSGLQHRMRKNAAGLTNICLFSSASLFTLCCSMCVLLGQGDAAAMLGKALAEGQIGLNTANLTMQELIMEFTTLAFLGVFFVLVFLACTALVLHYKQLAEGMEDAGRFGILRAVGLSDEMSASTAKKQLRAVFLLPLGTALVHIAFAAPILGTFMNVLAITDQAVLFSGIALSMLVFCAVYAACYLLTSRAYLRTIA